MGKSQGVGAVAGRQETRVDGYSSPRAKKLALQVSKAGLFCQQYKGSVGRKCCIFCKYCESLFVNITRFLCAG
jgi:hypothetical protein